MPIIVAFGDSITKGFRDDGSLVEEQTFRHLLQKALDEESDLEWKVINAGVGGNTTDDALKRIDADVLDHNPDYVTIMFGVNDASLLSFPDFRERHEPRVPLDRFERNLETIIEKIGKVGALQILMTPCPMGKKHPYRDSPPYRGRDMNFMLRDYAEAVRKIAREVGLPLLDVWEKFMEGGDPDKLLLDGVHPNADGHRVIADMLIGFFRGEE